MIQVGIIGLGFMGATHAAAYENAAGAGFSCRVAGVCDCNAEKLSGATGAAGNMATGAAKAIAPGAKRHGSFDALLADAAIELVSICTPTPTHVDLAIAALRAGKHVLVEKPVAVTTDPVRRLIEAARQSDRLIMPAMCMRFWPAWEWLKEAIGDKRFGSLRSLNLQRLGALPVWSGWFADPALSGGALVDLHIHDADFVRHCLGRPTAVTSAGHVNHVSTIYHYDDPGLHVTAQGGWLAPGTPFRMRYVAEFESATVDFDIGRKPALLLARGGEATPVDVSPLNGYDGEVRHFLTAVQSSHRPPLRATLEDAADVAIMLETEQYAAECGRRVTITWGVDEPPGH